MPNRLWKIHNHTGFNAVLDYIKNNSYANYVSITEIQYRFNSFFFKTKYLIVFVKVGAELVFLNEPLGFKNILVGYRRQRAGF